MQNCDLCLGQKECQTVVWEKPIPTTKPQMRQSLWTTAIKTRPVSIKKHILLEVRLEK